jgi:hypothetical protein
MMTGCGLWIVGCAIGNVLASLAAKDGRVGPHRTQGYLVAVPSERHLGPPAPAPLTLPYPLLPVPGASGGLNGPPQTTRPEEQRESAMGKGTLSDPNFLSHDF